MKEPSNDLLRQPAPTDHILQLYKDHRFLAEAVSVFIGSGMSSGEGAIVVAVPDHWKTLAPLLSGQGIDVPAAQERGQLAVLDAAETLPGFMKEGTPDAKIFRQTAIGVINQVRAAGFAKVRWWGEMVNLLWEAGKVDAFVRLEELFTEVGRDYSVSVFCSVSMDPFDIESHATGLPGAMKTHSHMIPEDDGRLQASVDRAMMEVLGESEAKSVAALIRMSVHPDAKTAAALSTVLLLLKHLPQFAGEILSLAGLYYAQQGLNGSAK